MRRVIALACLVVLSTAVAAVACRYTVRDIGFVDLRGNEFIVVVEGESLRPQLEQIKNRLRDSNIGVSFDDGKESIDGEASSTDCSNQIDPESTWSISLLDSNGRRITLESSSSSTEVPDVKDVLEREIFETTLGKLGESTVDSFAQVILIEGTDASANENAHAVRDEAILAIRKIEPLLPRPLQYPVRTLTVTADQREHEQVLLWSLGIDSENNSSSPIVAVVYGRGRLAGPVMVGDEIEVRETLAQLALVGESCECETDRAWLQERILPIDWPKDSRSVAVDLLGFDPDNPLVHAEVVRIVSRGPTSNGERRNEPTGGEDAIERLLLGYGETTLQPLESQAGGEEPSPPDDESGGQVRATIQTGSGWDFEEETDANSTESGPTVPGEQEVSGEPGPSEKPDALESPNALERNSDEVSEPNRAGQSSNNHPGDSHASRPNSESTLNSVYLVMGGVAIVVAVVACFILLRGRSV